MEDLLGFQDLLVTPLVFLVMYLFVSARGKRKYGNTVLYRYYINGFLLKATGSVAIGLVYFFYFGSGDTLFYFKNGKFLRDIFLDNIGQNWIVFFSEFFRTEIEYIPYMPAHYLNKSNSYMMLRISAITSMLTFSSYFASGLFFALYSFVGTWKLFTIFYKLYPGAHKRLAQAIIYWPSVIMWGSGIFKDTVTLGSLGILVYVIYKMFVERQFKIRYLILFFITFYMIGVVKSYVLLAIIPSVIFYVLNQYTSKIQSAFVRTTVLPIVMALVAISSFAALNSLSGVFSSYSIDNLEDKMEGFQRWHAKRSEQVEGSGYSLGIEAGSGLAGSIVKFPLAVSVTLFRPYLWEARKPFVFIAALESLFVLWITFRTITMVGLGGLFRSLLGDPFISFCFVFAIIFAFGVGVTSYNFGALVRFKIQCMPFYLGAIYLTRYNYLVANKLSLQKL